MSIQKGVSVETSDTLLGHLFEIEGMKRVQQGCTAVVQQIPLEGGSM